ncbi:sigma-54 interaction domain-containing protein [Mucilaginibacter agri]|uniref:AAA domain-containing protein n=1 Tax=Mucilaginibacter agri TaxID=2695265 RepID=A0A966DUW0_9SPHI|nr:sigma-54 dependent transcriptional regulator [Mucilaginibacter agri]NCD70837.1 AAA domain-containing protein [Mucilaginibacter agri]
MCNDYLPTIEHQVKETAGWHATSLHRYIDFDSIRKSIVDTDHQQSHSQRGSTALIFQSSGCESTLKYPGIIGTSPALKSVYDLIDKVSATNCTVLLLGETGTGKELIANAIHHNSPRKNKQMIKVNCAALPPTLIESELFGHERGSFTGAIDRRIGKFEMADNSTLFLDEIGEMPLELQVKLLRALQEREIERIGGKSTIKVNVRIIAATNRDLSKEAEAGRFRQDLYYRLNIFPISLPALRERKQDMLLLVSAFIRRFAQKSGKRIDAICNSALHELASHNWPGNIRELEHQIERSVILCPGNTLDKIYLPSPKQTTHQAAPVVTTHFKTLDESERDHISTIIKHCDGRIGGHMGAAQLLGVPASTLFSKMKKLGIGKDI